MARRRPWDPEPKRVTRTLASARRGSAGQRREVARRLLLRLMGFASPRFPPGQIPSHRGPNELAPGEAMEIAIVAADALRELGYEAAAVILSNIDRFGPYVAGRDALENLEAGGPSVWLKNARTPWSGWAVFAASIRRYRRKDGDAEYVIARTVDDPARWWRFLVGGYVYDRTGRIAGWDHGAGYTFQWRGRTLDDVLNATYGGETLTEEQRTDRAPGRTRRR